MASAPKLLRPRLLALFRERCRETELFIRPISLLTFWISLGLRGFDSSILLDFRGFNSSIILFLRCGIPRPIGNFPEDLSQAMSVGEK